MNEKTGKVYDECYHRCCTKKNDYTSLTNKQVTCISTFLSYTFRILYIKTFQRILFHVPPLTRSGSPKSWRSITQKQNDRMNIFIHYSYKYVLPFYQSFLLKSFWHNTFNRKIWIPFFSQFSIIFIVLKLR